MCEVCLDLFVCFCYFLWYRFHFVVVVVVVFFVVVVVIWVKIFSGRLGPSIATNTSTQNMGEYFLWTAWFLKRYEYEHTSTPSG